ncbi:MAG: beta-lactamase family protein [Vallitalea sp.]|jgi:CubicO group peptidase (beta-lactamase class C family)|nr:beta-lactamase family protein [Vallitalea sp.]
MLKNRLEKLQEKESFKNFSGVILIKKDEEVLYSNSFSYANRNFNIPNTIDTRFRIASVSKMFTAVAILQLIEKGLLDFDSSIVEVLQLQQSNISKDINIHHLLTHTSGIADYYDEEAGDEEWEKMWSETPIYNIRTLEDYLNLFIDLEPISKPGEKFQYNNGGYILLGLVIEKLSGVSYYDYIINNIFDKVNMKDSGFYSLDEVVHNMAEGYENIDGKWLRNIYTATPTAGSDGGAVTTANDLMNFITALQKGKLLDNKMTKKMLSPYVIDDKSNGFRDYVWKYGYANYYLLDNDETIIRGGHTGEEYGVSSRVYFYPQLGINVVILGNEGFNAGSVGWDIHDVIMEI